LLLICKQRFRWEPPLFNQIKALSSLIDAMNGASGCSQQPSYMYKYIRSVCFDFTDNTSIMIDIMNWCLSLMYANEDFDDDGKSILTIGGIDIEAELLNFRRQILRNKPLPSLNLCSTRAVVYRVNEDVFQPTAVIAIKPTGYSLFFPLFEIQSIDRHAGLLDNVKKDKLLNDLSNWKHFLKCHIDSAIDY
jgi:hypothetical protein